MTGCPATRNLCASRGVTPSTSSLRSGESPTTALSRLARCTTFETMERCPRSQTATLTRYSTRCLTTVERLVYNICHGMIESPRQLLLPPSIQAPSSFVSFTVYCTNSRTAAVSKRSTTPVKERKKTESATNVTSVVSLCESRPTGPLRWCNREANGNDDRVHQENLQGDNNPRYARMRRQQKKGGEHDQARTRVGAVQ